MVSTIANEAQPTSYPIICRKVSLRTCTHAFSNPPRCACAHSGTHRLSFDERVRVAQLGLAFRNRLTDEGGRVALVRPDSNHKILQ